MGLLGTVVGQIQIDMTQAIGAYALLQKQNAASVSAMKSSAATLGTVGNMFLGAGLAIAGALGYAADAAAKFNAQMDYFQAVSGATASQMEAIRAEALKLDTTTMFSTQDIAAMFTQLAQSGESTTEILNGVAVACTNLAQAAQIPLADATKDVVTAMSSFNLTADQAGMVANTFTGASKNSIISANDMATSLKYVGAIADSLGISLPDAATAMSLMGKAGIAGSMGGTELRQMLLSISAPTAAATKELTTLGIITKQGGNEFFQANGQAKSLGQIFQILQTATAGMGAEQQTAALKVLFASRAIGGATILTKAGAAGFDQMNAAISGTSAAGIAAARMDNLAGSTKILTSSLQTMAITAGQPLQNFLNGIVKTMAEAVQGFSHLSSGTQSAIIYFLAISSAVLLFLGALMKVVSFGMKVFTLFKQMQEAFVILRAGVIALSSGFWELTTAMLANPMVWIAIAVIAVGLAFYELWEHCTAFRDAIKDIGAWFKNVFEDVVNWFKKVPQYFDEVWADIKKGFTTALDWIKSHWTMIVGFIIDPVGEIGLLLWKKFGGTITAFFSRMVTDAKDGIEHFGEAIINELEKLPDQFFYWLGFILGRLLRWNIELAVLMAEGAKDAVIAMINFFEALPGEVIGFLDQMMNDWNNFWETMWGDTEKFGAEVYHAVINFFEALPGEIMGFLSQMVTDWENFSLRMEEDALAMGTSVYNAVVGFFQRLPGDLQNFFDQAVVKLQTWGQNMWNDAKTWGYNIYHGAMDFLEGIPGDLEGIFNKALTAIENLVTSAFTTAEHWAGSLWSGFKKGLGIQSPSFIEKQMTAISACMNTETQKMNGYVKQIQGLGAQLQNTNPATASSQYTAGAITTLGNSMTAQLAQLHQVNQAMGGSGGFGYTLGSTSGSMSGSAGMMSGTTKVLEVNVYNPTAESTAVSTTSQLRTLASMGAF